MLVFPGSTEIGLEIQSALRHCKEVRLFSAGSEVSSHAPYVFVRHVDVPSVHTSGWLDALNRTIAEQGIDYVFPAHDDVVLALAQSAEHLAAKVVSSPQETCVVTRSKLATYERLADVVPVPAIYPTSDAATRYPVFVKPDRGQGSQDTHLAHDPTHLSTLVRGRTDYLMLEYLPGDEYTVDCFSDREAGLLFCGGRRRVRTRSGISMHSVPARNGQFHDYARAISSRLELHGAWFFQVKESRAGVLTLLEVAPRIAGTMALHRVAGVNFPLLSLFEQERRPLQIRPNPVEVEIDRALISRYRHNLTYSAVYVDLDDTLVLDGKVNTELVRLLYQALNEGKRLVLITRHAADPESTLRRHRLAGLFDEVIHCEGARCKSDFIREPDAIFIDDSFAEREAVRAARGIPTFDCSMIEMLLDERA